MNPQIQALVIEYKKTKQQSLINEIFKLLNTLLVKKAKNIFYHQKFPQHTYKKRILDNETGEYVEKEFVECFRLCDIKKIDFEDVLQELRLEIFRIIENYDITRQFYTYLISSLWKWRPECIRTKQFAVELSDIGSGEMEDDELNNFENIGEETEPIPEKQNMMKNFEALTKQEKKLIKLKLSRPQLNQTQIAESLGVTQQRVSEILRNLRKKYKQPL
jgi:RNA polymerase sigma factor (sigma-70 family)